MTTRFTANLTTYWSLEGLCALDYGPRLNPSDERGDLFLHLEFGLTDEQARHLACVVEDDDFSSFRWSWTCPLDKHIPDKYMHKVLGILLESPLTTVRTERDQVFDELHAHIHSDYDSLADILPYLRNN